MDTTPSPQGGHPSSAAGLILSQSCKSLIFIRHLVHPDSFSFPLPLDDIWLLVSFLHSVVLAILKAYPKGKTFTLIVATCLPHISMKSQLIDDMLGVKIHTLCFL